MIGMTWAHWLLAVLASAAWWLPVLLNYLEDRNPPPPPGGPGQSGIG